jgi:hypothetical protein
MRKLRNNSPLPPYTPAIPEPVDPGSVRPTVAADLRVEEIIFKSYLFEKDRADASTRLYHEQVRKTRKVEELFKRYKMRGLAKKLFPSHNEATQ